MFYKHIKKKIFLVTFFLLFLFLFINFLCQIILVPVVSGNNLEVKIDSIEKAIKIKSEELNSLDELTTYLTLISYDNNLYFQLSEIGNNKSISQNINSKSLGILKENGVINENFFRKFIVDTSFGEYEVNLASTYAFDRYLENSLINVLSITFIFGIGILFLLVAYLQYYIGTPIIKFNNKLTKMLDEEYEVHKKPLNRLDEIGQANRKIDQLYVKYMEKSLELEGDEELKVKKEIIRRENLAIISHELKTPLTVLKLQTECMEANIGDYKNHSKYLRENLKIIETIQELVYSILGSLEIDHQDIKLSKDPISLKTIVLEQINEMSILWKNKGVNFDYHLSDVKRRVDEKMMKQAIKNIIENAIKYSEEDELIEITLDEDHLEVVNKNDRVSNKDLKNIFKPFKRVDDSRSTSSGGSGIGLYIVSEVLKKHGYHYSIEKVRNRVRFLIEFN